MGRLDNITLEELHELREQTEEEIPRERFLAAIGRKQGNEIDRLAERHGKNQRIKKRPGSCLLCEVVESEPDFHHWRYDDDEMNCYLRRECHDLIHQGNAKPPNHNLSSQVYKRPELIQRIPQNCN
jgi:hypothetical protein